MAEFKGPRETACHLTWISNCQTFYSNVLSCFRLCYYVMLVSCGNFVDHFRGLKGFLEVEGMVPW